MSKRVEKNQKITQKIEKEEKRELHRSQRKMLLKIGGILLVLFFSIFYYMRFIEPKRLVVKEIKIESPYFPESLNGLKIVHFSDLHYKMTIEEKDLQRIVDKINLLKPDILIFTGDLLDDNINYTEEDWQILTEAFQRMEGSISKYYVKGNHDYFTEAVDTILQNADFISLNNNKDTIYGTQEEKIQLIGLGSFIQSDFNSKEAFANQEEENFTIALFHEPDNILELQDKKIDLALAGHSHNSQIRLPYISNFFTVEGAKTYYKQEYQVNGCKLYVNAGIGTSALRLRLFAPPTINLYRLVRN